MASLTPISAPDILAAKRLVVKIGSALLVDRKTGLRTGWLSALAEDVAAAKARGADVILVSSGSIALGRGVLGLADGPLALEQSQAAAAVGQIRLARAYEEVLAPHGITTGQVLVTLEDTEDRRRYLNSRATMETLLSLGVVPIVNENDTVATDEIRYGDNDRLAARVAQMLGADVLVLLSDIDGLYDADPRSNPNANHIPEVRKLTPDIVAMAGGVNTAAGVGSGGMATKLDAARIGMTAGCSTLITLGTHASAAGPIAAVTSGAKGTWFIADLTPETARRQWLAGALRPTGSVRVDAGAARALKSGKSLLAAGVTSVAGRFERGDAVDVIDPDGTTIARGVSAYSSEDATRLIGRKSDEFEAILGYRGRPALIHVDDMVLVS